MTFRMTIFSSNISSIWFEKNVSIRNVINVPTQGWNIFETAKDKVTQDKVTQDKVTQDKVTQDKVTQRMMLSPIPMSLHHHLYRAK